MIKNIEISCPACESLFKIPVEFCGKVAECASCQCTFEIPTQEEIQQAEEIPDDSETVAAEGISSDTVKFERTSTGMIPDQDSIHKYGFDTNEFIMPENAKRDRKVRRFRMPKKR